MLCITCKRDLLDNDFTKNKKLKHRNFLDYECKECKSKKKVKYSHSINGVIQTIYDSQKQSCKQRNHSMPSYTKEDLKEWLLSKNEFLELYNKWVESNFNKDDKPSIDRLDDFKSYSFDNIRLCTFRENYVKGHNDRINGIGTQGALCKAVSQYDINGNLIKTYFSVNEAAKQTNIPHQNIVKVCQGKRITAGHYKWKYLNNESAETIERVMN